MSFDHATTDEFPCVPVLHCGVYYHRVNVRRDPGNRPDQQQCIFSVEVMRDGNCGGVRRQLVLQLFLRRSEFWDRVTAIRTEWKIAAKVLIPPIKPRPPGCFWDLPRPEGLPQVHPALTGPATDEDRRRWAREDPMRETHRWIETLTILHDEIVPTQHLCRLPGPSAPIAASAIADRAALRSAWWRPPRTGNAVTAAAVVLATVVIRGVILALVTRDC